MAATSGDGATTAATAPASADDAEAQASEAAAAAAAAAAAPGPRIRALLFDLDGTLGLTDDVHQDVFAELFAEHGVTVTSDYFKEHIHGRGNADIYRDCLGAVVDDIGEKWQAMGLRKEERFRERLRELAAEDVAARRRRGGGRRVGSGASGAPGIDRDSGVVESRFLVPGAADMVRFATTRGVRLACVTNAPRLNAECMLEVIGLADAFEHLVIGEECEHMKPHPSPYLTAMKLLGVRGAECVVFEDSRSGIRAGVAAGAAHVVGLCSQLSEEVLRDTGATATMRDFTGATEWLRERLGRERGRAGGELEGPSSGGRGAARV